MLVHIVVAVFTRAHTYRCGTCMICSWGACRGIVAYIWGAHTYLAWYFWKWVAASGLQIAEFAASGLQITVLPSLNSRDSRISCGGTRDCTLDHTTWSVGFVQPLSSFWILVIFFLWQIVHLSSKDQQVLLRYFKD